MKLWLKITFIDFICFKAEQWFHKKQQKVIYFHHISYLCFVKFLKRKDNIYHLLTLLGSMKCKRYILPSFYSLSPTFRGILSKTYFTSNSACYLCVWLIPFDFKKYFGGFMKGSLNLAIYLNWLGSQEA